VAVIRCSWASAFRRSCHSARTLSLPLLFENAHVEARLAKGTTVHQIARNTY
jgi:hypothetical protein